MAIIKMCTVLMENGIARCTLATEITVNVTEFAQNACRKLFCAQKKKVVFFVKKKVLA
jgi:hypothetical protein